MSTSSDALFVQAKARRSSRLPWTLLGLTVFFSIVAAAIGIPAENLWLFSGFIMFSPVGTVIALRRPENSIGWLYCVIGLSTAITADLFALIAAMLEAGSTDALLFGWLFLAAFPIAIFMWVG